MAKKPKEEVEVTGGETAVKRTRTKIEFKENPFLVVIGSSPKIVAAKPSLDDALKFVTEEIPVNRQSKAFIGQCFPVSVEVETKVKLNVESDD